MNVDQARRVALVCACWSFWSTALGQEGSQQSCSSNLLRGLYFSGEWHSHDQERNQREVDESLVCRMSCLIHCF